MVGVCAVIITNAELKIAPINLESVSLTDGTLDDVECKSVPLVRFRKSLSTTLTPQAKPTTFQQASDDKERTVLVMNARGLSKTLSRWDIGKLDPFTRLPWEGQQ